MSLVEEAKARASQAGEVVGLATRVSPISHGIDHKEIRAEVPFEVYLRKRFLVGSYIGIALPVSKTLVLGRITGVERADIMAISRIPALSPVEDTSGFTTPLTLIIQLLSEEVEGEVVPVSSPVDPQSPVFIPNRDFISKMLGLPDQGIEIGKLTEGYRILDVPVSLSLETLRHHVLVVGTTGAGKTNLLKVMISKSDVPLMVYDIQGDYVGLMAREGGTVLVPVPRGSGDKVTDFVQEFLRRSNLSNFRIVEQRERRFRLSDGERTFNLELMGFRLEDTYQLIPETSPFFSGQGAHFFRIATDNCLADIDSWIDQCARVLEDYNLHKSTVDNILRSVTLLRESGILDVKMGGSRLREPDYDQLLHEKSVVDLRWVLEKGVSSATTAAFIIANRVFRVIDSAYKESGRETPFLLIFDEAHEYFPQSRKGDEEKEALERLINRIMRLGRVRGIGTILATHRLTDLNDLILTLSNTKIAMRADEDALERIGMEDYTETLQASPPGYGVLRTFSLKVQDVIFRAEKYVGK